MYNGSSWDLIECIFISLKPNQDLLKHFVFLPVLPKNKSKFLKFLFKKSLSAKVKRKASSYTHTIFMHHVNIYSILIIWPILIQRKKIEKNNMQMYLSESLFIQDHNHRGNPEVFLPRKIEPTRFWWTEDLCANRFSRKWHTSWITSWSLTALRTLFLLVSWISPPRMNSSKIKYAFSKLKMISNSQTYWPQTMENPHKKMNELTLPKYLSSNST